MLLNMQRDVEATTSTTTCRARTTGRAPSNGRA